MCLSLAVSGWFTVAGLHQMSPVLWRKSAETVSGGHWPEVRTTMGKPPDLSGPPSHSQCDLWNPGKVRACVFHTRAGVSKTFTVFNVDNWFRQMLNFYHPPSSKVLWNLLLNSQAYVNVGVFYLQKQGGKLKHKPECQFFWTRWLCS